MIKSADLRDAIADLIKSRLNLKVFFNHVQNCADDYVFVRLRSKQANESFGRVQRKILVDFQVVLSPNNAAQVKHTDLLDIVDTLNEETSYPLQILDRYVTIYDTSSIIFDNILTYSFELNFTDCIESFFDRFNDYDFMEQLEIANVDITAP